MEPKDFSTSNLVSALLGQESSDDGITHLWKQADGRTTVQSVDGVPCRYLSRTNKTFGYLYFAIADTFKRDDLKAARIEFDFLSRRAGFLRLQYDALEGETHRPYKAALPDMRETINFGNTTGFMRFGESNGWQTVAFRVSDAAFGNSENGGADFRLEITTPDIYVRQVRVTRDNAQPSPPHSTQ